VETYEEAFFYVNEDALIPQIGKSGAEDVVDFSRKQKGSFAVRAEVRASLDNIKEISILPQKEFGVTRREKEGKSAGSVKE